MTFPTAMAKPTASEILAELEPLGSASYKRTMMKNHGVQEPCFGVKIGDLQKIRKRIGVDYQLALDLYATGNYDAMYLAGMIADDARMTRSDLERWADAAHGGCLAGTTVPSVAVGSPAGLDLAREWIESDAPRRVGMGWATLVQHVSIAPDAKLDLAWIEGLLDRVEASIHGQTDAVRYAMNSFVIGVGCFVAPLSDRALAVAEKIGPVTADLGPNACQVPFAPDYIRKVRDMGRVGKKRKSAKC